MYQEPTLVNVFVARVLPTGTAFGYRADTDGQVFIPSSLQARARFVEGEVIRVKLVPNPLHLEDDRKAPEKAIWIDTGEPPEPVMPASSIPDFLRSDTVPEPVEETEEKERDVRQEVFDFLDEEGGLWNQSEIASALFGGDYTSAERGQIRSALVALHKAEQIVRLAFYSSPGQAKASREFYTAVVQPWNHVYVSDED